MTLLEAQAELKELRGLAQSGVDLAQYRERISALYRAVCNKTIRKCNCRDKYRDALLEIYSILKMYKNDKDMEKTKATAKLVKGVIIFIDGAHYTNNNLTDEVAREFLARFPQRKDWFEVLPSATTEKQVVAEVAEMPENGGKSVSKDAKPQSKATTPKKKKTASKRK